MQHADDPIGSILDGSHPALAAMGAGPCPIRVIEIAPDLAGAEERLVRAAGLVPPFAVIADENTHEALGRRVEAALRPATTVVLEAPHADEEDARALESRLRHAASLVSVGSGTITDLVKLVASRTGRPMAAFATAPSMNGYVSGTASISAGGYKDSLKAAPPRGVFFDLGVLAAAPPRLIRAGVGDSLCRSTAQVDWLASHLILGTDYTEVPFLLQREAEATLLARAPGLLSGDLEAMAALVRLLVLGGLGMMLTGSSHPGSMGEHGISHYVDMLARPHPGSLHGEQVGVASLVMTRLQALMLDDAAPPRLEPLEVDEAAVRARFGPLADACLKGLAAKALDAGRLAAINARLQSEWPAHRAALLDAMLPLERLEAAFASTGTPTSAAALGIDPALWREAILHSRELRDRFSMLDLAAHAGRLEAFAAGEG